MLFMELRNEGKRLYKLIADKKAENDKAVDSLIKMKVYREDYIKRTKEKLDQEFQKVRDVAAMEFYGMIQKAVAEKRVALNKMLTDAPTADQTNLLTALQMRGNSIGAEEIKSIAVQFLGNYQALHTIQVIAEKAGFRLHFPVQYDYQELTLTLDRAEKYLMDRFHDLDTFSGYRNMAFDSRVFFDVWPDAEGATHTDTKYSDMAELLDGNQQITPETTVEPRALTDAEKAVVESLFSGVNRVAVEDDNTRNNISVPVDPTSVMNRIMNSPELLALVRLHPEYGKLLK